MHENIDGVRVTLDATPLLGRRTGVGRYVANLVAALASSSRARDMGVQLRLSTWTLRGGHLTHLPNSVSQVGHAVSARMVREMWQHTDHPTAEALVGATDIFHGTNFVSPPTRRAREIVTIHDLTYVDLPHTVSRANLAYDALVRRSLRRGAHVVTPSRTIAAAVRDHYDLAPERVTATLLGVEQAWFSAQPPTPSWLAAHSLPQEYLIFVGSLDPRKNLGGLLRAHAAARAADPEVPDLVLAGPAGRAQDIAPRPGVHLTGWLEDPDLMALVAGASALALPSFDEGFGLPALEATAAGRPVVAADIAVLREVVGPHAQFATPHDDDALAQALIDVIRVDDSPGARQARRDWAARFTWERCADATLYVYAAGQPG